MRAGSYDVFSGGSGEASPLGYPLGSEDVGEGGSSCEMSGVELEYLVRGEFLGSEAVTEVGSSGDISGG